VEHQTIDPAAYFHVRIVLGMVLGLSVARLLSGVAVFVQHPGRYRLSWLHLGWTLQLFLLVIHFWWFEYQLRGIERMTFPIYVFVLIYCSSYFILCTLLYPNDIDEYSSYEDYFLTRRAWFFGLLAIVEVLDLVDTAIKGRDYFMSLGIEYPLRNLAIAVACITAIFVGNRRFHLALVAALFVSEAWWIWRLYDDLT
jgi:hypothetical protein